MTSPFDFINDLSQHKKNLSNSESFEKDYNSFIINRGFSNYLDTLMFSNEINMYSGQDKQLQHDYYFYSLPAKKRWSKWNKKIKIEKLELIQKIYKVNNIRAMEILQILSAENLKLLKNKQNQGG